MSHAQYGSKAHQCGPCASSGQFEKNFIDQYLHSAEVLAHFRKFAFYSLLLHGVVSFLVQAVEILR